MSVSSISVIFLSALRANGFFKRHLFIVKDCRSDAERETGEGRREGGEFKQDTAICP